MATSIFHHNFPQVDKLQQAADKAQYIIGLDLHKKTTAITVLDVRTPEKPVYQRKRLKNEKLLRAIQEFSGKKVVIVEASYGWFPVRNTLINIADITFVAFDPCKTSSWIAISGIKSDKIDSEVLAYACLQGGIARLAVYPPGREAKERFKLVRLREQVVGQRTRVKNQLKAIGREYGPNPYTGEISEKSEMIVAMENMLLDQLKFLNEKIKVIEIQMAVISKDDKVTPILAMIPGIGSITSYALRWKMETISRFKDAKHLSSYFGFGIRQRQSGESLVKGKITKRGNRLIRTLLIQGAQRVLRAYPEYVKLYFPKLADEVLMKDKKHVNKLVTAIARKQLTFVYRSWKTMEPFSIEEYRKRREEILLSRELVSKDESTDSSKAADPGLVLVR